jgi:hypothetical protein
MYSRRYAPVFLAAWLLPLAGPATAESQSNALATAAAGLPRTFVHDPAALARRKTLWLADPKSEAGVAALLDEAGRLLDEKPFSVVDKDVVPPSGDKHDFMSRAPYAWPDPRKPNGLPYVVRDGQVNPERDKIPDHHKLGRICMRAEQLGLAYFFSGDDKFAAQAARLLRTFFISPATRMNPNLNFGQGVPGKENGRAAGIIDAATIALLVDGVGMLASSRSWIKADQEAMAAWFRAYLTWLRESELGRKEGRAGNNHGTWYDVQVVSLALATGQVELAGETLSFARKRRIGRQIDPDGRQPEELQRTRPWHYAAYNLQAMVLLARLGERAGVDLWHYQTPDGRSIRKAIGWLLPFALGTTAWSPPDLDGLKPAELWPVLRAAASALKDAELGAAAEKVGHGEAQNSWLFLD